MERDEMSVPTEDLEIDEVSIRRNLYIYIHETNVICVEARE